MPIPAGPDPLFQPWKAQPDNLVGGWCVTSGTSSRTPADGALVVADFAREEIAVHVADLHNAWLARQ